MSGCFDKEEVKFLRLNTFLSNFFFGSGSWCCINFCVSLPFFFGDLAIHFSLSF